METGKKKSSFFLNYLIKGLIWLAFIVALFVFAKHTVSQELMHRFTPFFDNTGLILFIYSVSELVVGMIPPEFFMIWSLRSGDLNMYIFWVTVLAFISYAAGVIAYFFGRYLHNTRLYRYLHHRYLEKTEILLKEYGLYLILVSSLTPIPFSGVAMLVGAVHYPIKQYVYLSVARFAKFALSAYVIWEANMI